MPNQIVVDLLDRGFRAHLAGDLLEAKSYYEQALGRDPESADAWKAMGVLACQQGDFIHGEKFLREATLIAPTDAEVWANHGNALRVLGRHEESAEACRRALSINPDCSTSHTNLSASYRELGNLEDAIRHAQIAIEIDPRHVEASINLGAAFLAIGLADSAAEVLGNAIQSNPASYAAWSNWLFSLQYSNSLREEDIAKAHRLYGSRFSTPRQPSPISKIETIGFIGGDFNHHPVSRFLLPLFESERGHKYICIHTGFQKDETTERFRELADGFFDAQNRSDDEVARIIRQARVDLLIDLSGHTAGNRLPVLAMRPAPIQATWLGYSASTGLKEIDYFIGDAFALKEVDSQHFSECFLPMEGTAFHVKPSSDRTKTPKSENFCFGSLNNPSKISDQTLSAWIEILSAEPSAEMIIKYPRFDSELPAGRILAAFDDAGIDLSRITIIGKQTWEDHQQSIRRMNLILDTFPYNGATTTCDALAQGVPVLTFAGNSYRSRMTASILNSAGLQDWITGSRDEYVTRAIACAQGKVKSLSRTKLIKQITETRLCQPQKLSRDFQNVILRIEDLSRSKISA